MNLVTYFHANCVANCDSESEPNVGNDWAKYIEREV